MTLAEVALQVRADTNRLRPDVEKASVDAGRSGGEKLGAGLTAGVDKEIGGSRGRFLAAGRSLGADLGKGFSAEFSGASTFAKTLATMASRMAIMGAAAGAAAPGVANLAAALAPAAGAAVVLPAALLSIRAATLTARVAVMGFGDAVKAGFGSDAKAAAEELNKLSGSARTFAKEVIGLRPQVVALQKSVSSRFFTPLVGELRPLADQYLPMLKAQMGDLAGTLGGLGEQFLRSARDASVMSAVSDLFDASSISVVRLRGAVDPLVTTFASLISATAPELPGIADGLARMATNLATFVQNAVDSGRVYEVFQNAKDTLSNLGGILRNVGSILGTVFSAATAGSSDLLSNLLDLTGQAAAFFQTAQAGDALKGVFATLAQLGAAMRTGLAAVMPAIAQSITALAPAVAGLAGPAAQLVVALAPLLPFVAGLAATVVSALTPALAVLAGWLAKNETVMKVAVVTIGAFIVAAKLSAAAAGVQAAGGIAAWTRATITGSSVGKAFTAVQYGLGAAMRFALGPIGLVIAAIGALVAAVVWAYKNNESFRNLVNKVWAQVRDYIKSAITTVGNIIRTTWLTVISPALTRLNQFVRNVLVPTVNFLWKNVVQPAFTTIGFIVKAAWAVIRLALAAWVTLLKLTLFPVIRALWNDVVKPVFNGVRDTIRGVWENGIRPVLRSFGDFMKNTLAPGFKSAVGAIGKAWEGLRELARKPVAFVVNSVINPLIGGFNKLAGTFGTPKIDKISGFERGGQIPGVPSLRDNMLAQGPGGLLKVAAGEFVTNTRSTLANLPLLKAINEKRGRVGRGDIDPYLDGYERGGGPIGDGIGDFFGKLKSGLSGIGSFIADPKAALTKAATALLERIPGAGGFRDMLVNMGRTAIRKIGDWLSGEGGAALGAGGGAESWQSKRAIIARWFPGLQMISGPRPGSVTLSGNRSLHADGLAVDYPPVRALAARIRAVYGKQTQELITPWNDLNLLRGRPHRFTGPVWNQHNFAGGNAHVHWGAQNGGLVGPYSGISQVTAADFGSVTLQRGWNMVHNGLGRTEPLVDPNTANGEMLDVLRQILQATQDNPAGFAKAMGGTSAGLMRQARRW